MTARHLILVGLPGAGKTTVGRLVAETLDMAFVDVDDLIEESTGSSVGAIFADRGEAAFRRLERRSVAELMRREHGTVIAPGGGWAAEPHSLDSVEGRALTVYLETAPEVATALTGGPGGGEAGGVGSRPLLDSSPPTADRETRMRELYERRRRCYAGCELVTRTDDVTAADVARKVAELARNRLG